MLGYCVTPYEAASRTYLVLYVGIYGDGLKVQLKTKLLDARANVVHEQAEEQKKQRDGRIAALAATRAAIAAVTASAATAASAVPSCAAAAKLGQTFRLMTFNIKYAFDEISCLQADYLSLILSEKDGADHPIVISLQEVAGAQWNSCKPTPAPKDGKLGVVASDLGYKVCFAKAFGDVRSNYAGNDYSRIEFIGMLYDDKNLKLETYGLLDVHMGEVERERQRQKHNAPGARTSARAKARRDKGEGAGGRPFVLQPFLAVFRFRKSNPTLVGLPLVVITFHLTCADRFTADEALWLYATVKALNIPEHILVIINGDSNVPPLNEQWKKGFTNGSQEEAKNPTLVYEHLLGETDWTMMTKQEAHDGVLMRANQRKDHDAKPRVLNGWTRLSDHNPVLTTLNNVDVNRDKPGLTTAFLVRLKELQAGIGEPFIIEILVD